jgi:hypothetical protein
MKHGRVCVIKECCGCYDPEKTMQQRKETRAGEGRSLQLRSGSGPWLPEVPRGAAPHQHGLLRALQVFSVWVGIRLVN